MNRSPLFTVIVPTFNRPQLLAEALASVQAQSVSDFECLIVNDAGPQPTVAPDDARFRVLHRKENGGQGASFNTGIRAARGQYVAFLDDDDLFCADRLAIALEGLQSAHVSVCLSDTCGQPRKRRKRRSSPRILRGDVSRCIREDMTPNMGQTAVVRDRLVYFDESLRASADVEWWIRMAARNSVWTVPQIGLRYRVHSGTRHNNAHRQRVQALRQIRHKHESYFRANRKAAAFHFRRIGFNALRAGMSVEAVGALWRSFVERPTARSAYHLCRSGVLLARAACSRWPDVRDVVETV